MTDPVNPLMQAVRDRPFTTDEVEQVRLLLSTFRDGSGQRLKVAGGYMPDYLAFERVTAAVLGGDTNEDKGIFDVAVPRPRASQWGVSCKMTAKQPVKNKTWFMELSNSAKKLTDAQEELGIDWRTHPELAGPNLIETVRSWHDAVRDFYDVDASKYLLITHDRSWKTFQMACFDIDAIESDLAGDIEWVVEGGSARNPSSVAGYIEHPDPSIEKPHRLWQWFARSGGQLKFYPPLGWEEWKTEPFELETCQVKDLKAKVDEYWPGAWPVGSVIDDPETDQNQV